jgi:hypothetical protein
MAKLRSGVEIINGEREYASEAVGGFILAVITILFAPLGIIFDLILSLVALAILVPIYKFIFNWFLYEFQSSLKYMGIKYIGGAATVLFVALMEMIVPSLVVITLILGILFYIFIDDAISIAKEYYNDYSRNGGLGIKW